MNVLEQVVTVQEAAELLGRPGRVGSRFVQRKCVDGKLDCRKSPDGVWLITLESVKSMM